MLFGVAVAAHPADTTAKRNRQFPFSLGLRSHYGFIIPHSSTIREVSRSKPWGLELDAAVLLTGDRAWDYCLCYPRMGLSLSYFNYANPRVLGNGYTLLYYVEPFLSYRRRVNFSFRTGGGVAYLDTPYHPVTNPSNLFYSAPLSFLLQINLALNYRLSPHLNLRAAGYYSHISNGGMREPNKGINFPTASLGLDYTFRPPVLTERSRHRPGGAEARKNYFEGALAFTAKPANTGERQRHPIVGGVGTYHRVVSRRSVFHGGAAWESDWTLKEKAERLNQRTGFHRASLVVGHDLLIGRFEFSQVLGVYVYSPYRPMDPVYQRYSLKFRLNRRLFTAVTLKAHRQVADYLDGRIGVRF
ncbi:MAG: acyloxyacyl hydrolase [Cytophagales bacterium]|nr:acyloxyacyl hydrolase [Cytophagales bacterium]